MRSVIAVIKSIYYFVLGVKYITLLLPYLGRSVVRVRYMKGANSPSTNQGIEIEFEGGSLSLSAHGDVTIVANRSITTKSPLLFLVSKPKEQLNDLDNFIATTISADTNDELGKVVDKLHLEHELGITL